MKKRNYRLFFSILKENLTDIEALDGVKKFFSELWDFSAFLSCILIIISADFVINTVYHFLFATSWIEFLSISLLWGGIGLAINEIFFKLKARELDKKKKKLMKMVREAVVDEAT
jgi:hypothetical protein